MRMIFLIFSYLFLSIGIVKAQCLNPQALSDAWGAGGKERVLAIIQNEMRLPPGTDPSQVATFPDVRFGLSSRTTSSGELVCDYRDITAFPHIIIRPGKMKVGPPPVETQKKGRM